MKTTRLLSLRVYGRGYGVRKEIPPLKILTKETQGGYRAGENGK